MFLEGKGREEEGKKKRLRGRKGRLQRKSKKEEEVNRGRKG